MDFLGVRFRSFIFLYRANSINSNDWLEAAFWRIKRYVCLYKTLLTGIISKPIYFVRMKFYTSFLIMEMYPFSTAVTHICPYSSKLQLASVKLTTFLIIMSIGKKIIKILYFDIKRITFLFLNKSWSVFIILLFCYLFCLFLLIQG